MAKPIDGDERHFCLLPTSYTHSLGQTRQHVVGLHNAASAKHSSPAVNTERIL